MKLSELAHGFTFQGPDRDIAGLARDSRHVREGFLFAALTGEHDDGRRFITDAINKGAKALLVAPGTEVPEGISVIAHPEPRNILAQLAARFYPIQPATMAAVTGTSGKTSTVQFLRQIWQRLGHKSASIGTLGIIADGFEKSGSLTTPDSITLHQDLQMLAKDKHITHVAMEASSHGLDQLRLDAVKLKLAAFTNFSRDHLDYHKTMEEYLAAKLRLFSDLLPASGVAVLNKDIAEFEMLAATVKKHGSKLLTYGMKDADVTLLAQKPVTGGQELTYSIMGKNWQSFIPLAGTFQAANVTCAAALALASGEDTAKIMDTLPKLEGVRGRLEYIGAHQGGAVYVDYAHKPDALENILQALRAHTSKRLIVLFGCGGNRDAGKRPLMGEIACKRADEVIVTDDNPRHEDPALIRKAVMSGCKSAKEIGDRAEAIAYALSMINEGDVLVIAGKGHEQGQIIGDDVRPFDDASVVRRFMKGKAA